MTAFTPPPADRDAEMATLGAMLNDGSVIGAVLEVLPDAEAFFDTEHRTIFRAIRALHDEGKPMDVILLDDDLRSRGELEAVGGRDYLVTLCESAPSAVNAAYYAGIVRDKHRRRRAMQLARRLCEAAESGNGELDAAIRRIPDELVPSPDVCAAESAATPLADLLREEARDVKWIVDGLLPAGGLSLVVGKPKTGKTTLCRCLALAVARSASFLGRACHGGPVLYLGLEDRREATANHFRRLGATDEPIAIMTERPAPIGKDAVIAVAGEILRLGAVLAIVDTLARLTDVGDWNAYGDVQRSVGPLLDLARETGCHVALLHHCSKTDKADGDSILGSTALFGMVDVAITLRRSAQGRTLSTMARYGQDIEPTVVTLDPETGAVTAAGTVRAARQADIGREIVAVLNEKPGMTEPDLREAVKGAYGAVHNALEDLLKAGAVERSGTGKPYHPFRFSTLNSSLEGVESGEFDDPALDFPPSPDRPDDGWATEA